MQPTDISPPVMPDDTRKGISWPVRIGLIAVIMCVGLVTFLYVIQSMMAREAVAKAKRFDSLMNDAQAITAYEQSYQVAIITVPDWKRALVDSGYASKEMFESRFAVNRTMNYIVLARSADQFMAGSPSWVAIYEDPRSLIIPERNIRAMFQGDTHVSLWDQVALSRRVLQKCHDANIPFDPATTHLTVPEETPPAPANPK